MRDRLLVEEREVDLLVPVARVAKQLDRAGKLAGLTQLQAANSEKAVMGDRAALVEKSNGCRVGGGEHRSKKKTG